MKYKFSSLVLFIATVAIAEQTVLLKIEGIDDPELKTNVRIYLSQVSNDEADGSKRYQHRVQEAVDKALRAKGYYNTQYHFNLTSRPRPQKDLLHLQIKLDQPIKLDEREVNIDGQAATDSDFEQLLAQHIPAKGTVLNHGTYDDFKSSIEKLAQAKGYFDGQWTAHRLEVYPQDYLADWRLFYASGARYRYGKIEFKNSQIREEYLRNVLRIREGDPYYINDLSKLSSDLSSSNWFGSVLVDPHILLPQLSVRRCESPQ